MNSIKRNPGIFIKLFGLLYLTISFIEIVYNYILYKFVYGLNVPLGRAILWTIAYVPYVLFLVYIFAFYKKKRNHILLPIAYILLGLQQILSLIVNIKVLSNDWGWFDSFGEMLRYEYSYILSALSGIIMLAFIVFYIVDCFSKFKFLRISKILILIQAGLSIGFILLNVIFNITYWKSINIVSAVFSLVSTTFCMLAYIIFWRCGVTTTTSIESDLYELKRQLDKGRITEEEFKVKKIEILNKL